MTMKTICFSPIRRTSANRSCRVFCGKKDISKVDYILATHADTDHMQGLIDVAKNFKVRAALFGRTPFEDADFAELFEVLQKKKIETVTNFARRRI